MQIDQPNVRRSAPAQARNALAAEIDQALFGGCDLRGFDEYVEIAHHAGAESFPRRREQVSGAFRQRRLDARAVECRQQLVQLCQQARVSLDIVIVDMAQERGDIMRRWSNCSLFASATQMAGVSQLPFALASSAIQSTARGRRPCRHSQSHPTAMLGWLIGRYGRGAQPPRRHRRKRVRSNPRSLIRKSANGMRKPITSESAQKPRTGRS